MKTLIFSVLSLLGTAAWADGPPALPDSYTAVPQATAQPAARPYAQATPQAYARPAAQSYAQPGAQPYAQATPQAYAQPAAQGGAAQYRYAPASVTRPAYPAYGSARPAARPTARPTPSGPIRHVGDFSPYWSAALRLGAGLPLGSLSNYNGIGFGGQADVFYQAAPDTALDLFAAYTGMPATGLPSDTHTVFYQGTVQPTSLVGLGLKGVWQFYDIENGRFFVDGGLGYVSLTRSKETAATGVPAGGDTTWTFGSGPAISGLLLTAGLGVS
ncbi:MAG TPA: hypothetical protein VNZ67_05170, partial [bacterium]|nr:hypothetical protein [bacterium]